MDGHVTLYHGVCYHDMSNHRISDDVEARMLRWIRVQERTPWVRTRGGARRGEEQGRTFNDCVSELLYLVGF